MYEDVVIPAPTQKSYIDWGSCSILVDIVIQKTKTLFAYYSRVECRLKTVLRLVSARSFVVDILIS